MGMAKVMKPQMRKGRARDEALPSVGQRLRLNWQAILPGANEGRLTEAGAQLEQLFGRNSTEQWGSTI